MPFRRFTILLVMALLLLGECLWLLFSKKAAQKFGEIIQDHAFWKHAAIEEVVFALALFLWAYLHSRTPALDHTEMFMDHGFVKSLLNADYLPSLDMWYAGSTINYYYYGQYVTALLCKLTGRSSGVGYNLMMATLFALTLMLSFSIVYHLLNLKKEISAKWAVAGGILASLLVSLSGNAHALFYAIIFPFLGKLRLMEFTFPHNIDRYWYPDATRYIHCFEGSKDATITEFPLYSFVLSDLHAHVVDIIFVLLFLALLIVWVTKSVCKNDDVRTDKSNKIRKDVAIDKKERASCAKWEWVQYLRIDPMVFLLGFVLGIMGMTNYWDFAIYLVVFAFFSFYRMWIQVGQTRVQKAGMHGHVGNQSQLWKRPQFYVSTIVQVVYLFLIGMIVMLPFSLSFDTIRVGLAFAQDHSPINEYLVLWGIPLVWTALFFIYCFRQKKQLESADFIVGIFFVCAIGLIVAPEVLYIKDIYTTAPRCNTMFKFTYQAFILFGLATGYTVVCLLGRSRMKKKKRFLLAGVVLLLLIPPFCYPYYAIHEVYFTGENAGTLDGLAYIGAKDASEYAAIQWIDENTAADAVILEANALSYTEGNRISMATGRQTVQGWWTHQMLWRNMSSEELNVRIQEIKEIYEGTDAEKTEQLIEKYGIDYIYVGNREAEQFTNLQIKKLMELGVNTYDFHGSWLVQCH